MRRFALPIALGMVVVGVAPVLADGGLPEIANLRAGPFVAVLHNDAPTLVTGSNTLTVEVPALPDRHAVSLSLTGPRGERLDVPLRPVQVLDGPPDAHTHDTAGTSHDVAGTTHDMSGTSHDLNGMSHDMNGMSHDMSGMSHDMNGMSHDASGAHAGSGDVYRGRGSVSVPETGSWQAHLVIRAAAGGSFVAEAPLTAEDGGPNGLYLAGAGALMGGFLVYGATRRRLNPTQQLMTRGSPPAMKSPFSDQRNPR